MSTDKALAIVRAILSDMRGRHGLRQAWEDIDESIQEEIKQEWAELIVRETDDPA